MKIPFIKSRNFSSFDISRSKLDVDAVGMYLTGYAHGYSQALRDACFKKFGSRFKGLVVTSSNRSDYNDSIPNAAPNSHHEWRLDKNSFLHVALDYKPLGITLEELYEVAIATLRGEIYLNHQQGIVHVALVAQEDEHWKQ